MCFLDRFVRLRRYNEFLINWLPTLVKGMETHAGFARPDPLTSDAGPLNARLFIYSKGPRVDPFTMAKIKKAWVYGPVYTARLPNYGRETHTFAMHALLRQPYGDFSQHSLFLQGNAEEVVDSVYPMLEAMHKYRDRARMIFGWAGVCFCTGCQHYWSPQFMEGEEVLWT